jgi:hypothetical protein
LALEHDYDLETAIYIIRSQYRDPLESLDITEFHAIYEALQ